MQWVNPRPCNKASAAGVAAKASLAKARTAAAAAERKARECAPAISRDLEKERAAVER